MKKTNRAAAYSYQRIYLDGVFQPGDPVPELADTQAVYLQVSPATVAPLPHSALLHS